MSNALRVLVADDHPINRLVFREVFEQLGCDVEAVETGENAIRIAASVDFDLVCLDRHMSGVTGDEVAGQLSKEQFVVAWFTDLANLPARFNGILAKPLTAVSAANALSLARARLRPASLCDPASTALVSRRGDPS
ncbi:MAG: response regulator [Phenylobacterium sp.]|nr:response regulator [Phenylobacterium sp.]